MTGWRQTVFIRALNVSAQILSVTAQLRKRLLIYHDSISYLYYWFRDCSYFCLIDPVLYRKWKCLTSLLLFKRFVFSLFVYQQTNVWVHSSTSLIRKAVFWGWVYCMGSDLLFWLAGAYTFYRVLLSILFKINRFLEFTGCPREGSHARYLLWTSKWK